MPKLSLTEYRTSAYRPELDVFRFAAFALVFVHHLLPRASADCPGWLAPAARIAVTTFANMCGYGLSLFFMLSAFIITDLLLREKAKAGTVSIRNFYVRRILRIWPLYFLAISVGLAFELAAPSHRELIMLGMYALMIGNWFFSFTGWTGHFMTPLWSISIEEQFYLFWPAVMKTFGRRGQAFACAVLVGLAIACEVALGEAHAAIDTTIWTNSFVQFETFAAGALLAIYLDGRTTMANWWARATFGLVGIALWWGAVYVFAAKSIGAAQSGAAVVAGSGCALSGTMAILLSMLGLRVSPASRLVYLGKISFGLYVFHLSFIELAQFVSTKAAGLASPDLTRFPLMLLSIVPTVVVAHVSYRCFESRFLLLKTRFTTIPSQPIDEVSPLSRRATNARRYAIGRF